MKRLLPFLLLVGLVFTPSTGAYQQKTEPVKAKAADDSPTITLPKTIAIGVARKNSGGFISEPVLIDVVTTGTDLKWKVPERNGKPVFRVLPQYGPAGGTPVGLLLINATLQGSFDLAVSSASGGKSTVELCTLVIGEEPPVPDPLPDPSDPFAQSLQKLYDADVTADKAKNKGLLAALYRQAMPYADDDALVTTGQMKTKLATASAALLPPPDKALTGIRLALRDDMNQTFGTDSNASLDTALRATIKAMFKKFATALDAIK